MRVLSLFDGISCGQVALKRAGFNATSYLASEIEQSAIRVALLNHPETVQLGCVTKVREAAEIGLFNNVDLLLAGSPCQGFSQAGVGLAFDDPRSALFFDFVHILKKTKPHYFLLENVNMKKEWRDIVTSFVGVEPININSKYFSAQHRNRWYWTNIPVLPWVDRKIMFWAIREYVGSHLSEYKLNKTPSRMKMWNDGNGMGNDYACKNITYADKSNCLTTKQDRFSNAGLIEHEDFCRYLTVTECERLQTLPDGYCSTMSKTAAWRALGNGWTIDVIAHILKGMRP